MTKPTEAEIAAAAAWLMDDDTAYREEPQYAHRAAQTMLEAAWGARVAVECMDGPTHPLDGLLEPGARVGGPLVSLAISAKRIADALTAPEADNPIARAIVSGIGNGAQDWIGYMVRAGR